MATKEIKFGRFRLNGTKVEKSSILLKQGDIIVFSRGLELKAVKVVALGTYRGPFSEALTLYEDVSKEQFDF